MNHCFGFPAWILGAGIHVPSFSPSLIVENDGKGIIVSVSNISFSVVLMRIGVPENLQRNTVCLSILPIPCGARLNYMLWSFLRFGNLVRRHQFLPLPLSYLRHVLGSKLENPIIVTKYCERKYVSTIPASAP